MAGYPGRIRADYAALKRAGIPGGDGYRGPHTTHTVDGGRRVRWRCTRCQTVNEAPYTVAGTTRAPCSQCKKTRTQERVR